MNSFFTKNYVNEDHQSIFLALDFEGILQEHT